MSSGSPRAVETGLGHTGVGTADTTDAWGDGAYCKRPAKRLNVSSGALLTTVPGLQ